MSTTPSLPSYIEFNDALQKVKTTFEPSQVHGLICGLLCATTGKIDNSWQNLISEDKNRVYREALTQLFETSFHLISEFSFEFTLLLPPDDVDINERTEALGLWCQGFLTGLERGKVQIENREPSEITEAINDIIEISQVGFGDLTSNEEDELAYFELVEYVRLAALMIFHELNSDTKQPLDLQ